MRIPANTSGLNVGGDKSIVVLLVLLVLFLLGTLGIFWYVDSDPEPTSRNEAWDAADEQQLLTQRMITASLEAAIGKQSAFLRLQQLRDRFDASLNKAQGVPAQSAQALADVERGWTQLQAKITAIIGSQDAVAAVADQVVLVNQATPGLLAASDELVNLLVRAQADPAQVYVAARQLMITQRIANNLNLMLAGGDTASAAAAGFGRDVELYSRVLEGLLTGSSSLSISRIDDPGARAKLTEAAKLFETIGGGAESILEAAPKLAEIGAAATEVESLGNELIVNAAALEASVRETSEKRNPLTYLGYLFGFLSLLILLALGYKLVQDARRQLELTTNQNRRNQRAILRLLDEMTNLAEGDLTMRATVTEDITGAIADSVNYAIDALRGLVTTINHTSVQVASSAEKTQSTTQRLADASNYQAREIASASAAITEMADSIEQVSKNALTSAEVAQRSVEIAHKGAQTVSRTIDGMDTIREQIQETAKRIKRLGESSQEIGDIVSLINEIADQTNILALNAAIQASTAGEAGRGFAVVADEVQRLAERAGNATKQIEALVKTIQADTNEAVISMEQSTTNVVGGAKLAEDAGEALAEIESVSGQLAQLIQSISQSARQQASAAANITNTMNVIQEITMQTSEGTSEAANSVGNLTTLANELRRSVAGFKLPDADEADTVIIDPDDHPLQQSAQSAR